MDYHGTDFYCDVAIPRKIPLKVVYEDDDVLAYHHTKPFWPVHIVVVPKRHIPSLLEITGSQIWILNRVIAQCQIIADSLVKEYGAARVITNLGKYQDSKHLHFHVAFGNPLK